MYQDAPEDFVGPFGDPVSMDLGVYDHELMLLLLREALILVSVLAVVAIVSWQAGRWLARRRIERQRKKVALDIYETVHRYLMRALEAPAECQFQHTRELVTAMESRLEPLLAFQDTTGNLFDEMRKVLETPSPERPVSEVPQKEVKPPKVKYEKTLTQQRLEIWQALQAMRAVWEDKAYILALIEGAQAELTRANTLKKSVETEPPPSSPTPSSPSPTGPYATFVSPSVDAPPTEGKTRKGVKSQGKKLPKHKKNMLA